MPLHHAPVCNYVSRKEHRHDSRSGVHCSPRTQFVRTKHQLRSCDCPNPRRLSNIFVVQHRTVRDQVGVVTEEVPWDFWTVTEFRLHRRETRNRHALRRGTLTHSYSVCGWTSARMSSSMSSDSWAWCSTLPCCCFAFPAQSTTSMPRCSHQFMNSSLICARCGASVVACMVSTRHQSAVSAESEMFPCPRLHSVHRASFTDHMQSVWSTEDVS